MAVARPIRIAAGEPGAPVIVSLEEGDAVEAGEEEEIPEGEDVEEVEDLGEDDADVFLPEGNTRSPKPGTMVSYRTYRVAPGKAH